jgi:hypothetical protein
VRMVQRRKYFRFALKPHEPIAIRGECGRQDSSGPIPGQASEN